MPSCRRVHPAADQGCAEVMGRQARDRPPKGVMDRPNGDIARATEIAPPLRLLGLGLPPGSYPTAPAIGGELRTMMGCRNLLILGRM